MNELVKNQLAKVNKIKDRFGNLFNTDIIKPIPFFGDIQSAEIITVGVNPSADEIKNNGWYSQMTEDDIVTKLLGYYQDNPHPWFVIWREALARLGKSYENGTAAHVDLCPWATKSISTINAEGNISQFEGLLSLSLEDFYKTLTLCKNAKYVILAGAATNKDYVNEFLYSHRTRNGELENKPQRLPPAPYTNYHTIRIEGKALKTFSLSVSPSARGSKKYEVVEIINKNKNFFA